jgi:hypothetical protein
MARQAALKGEIFSKLPSAQKKWRKDGIFILL